MSLPHCVEIGCHVLRDKADETPKIISHHDGKNQAYSLQDTDIYITLPKINYYVQKIGGHRSQWNSAQTAQMIIGTPGN